MLAGEAEGFSARVSSGKNATRRRILSTKNATIFSRVFPVEK
jgi:hypothetical protein